MTKQMFEELLIRRTSSLDGYLGIDLVEINEEAAVLTMPVTEKIHQAGGVVHGGIYLVLAESAAGVHAAYLADLEEYFPVGIENSASHVRSARDGHLRATASLVRRSRSFTVHEVKVEHEESGGLLSTARVTHYYRPSRPAEE
ncbi:MAG: PaaI family thioesterase [Anaerolineales bacterium]|nr:PaaI family thioesterase [Anaerolineales bacterium]